MGALLAVPMIAALVVLLERLQARDSPVVLETHGAGDSPTGAQLEDMGKTLPDSPRRPAWPGESPLQPCHPQRGGEWRLVVTIVTRAGHLGGLEDLPGGGYSRFRGRHLP